MNDPTLLIPNASAHKPNPKHLRRLIKRAGISQAACASLIGIDARTMRRYLALPTPEMLAPYAVQFALEALARAGEAGLLAQSSED